MKHYYCSTFSKDYIYKGLLLYNSLLKCEEDFHFFIICLHDEVKVLLDKMNLDKATPIALSTIEQEDEELLKVKSSRNDKEYAWTSKASAMLYILKHFDELDHIVWLDGDTHFYSNPQPIFDEWGDQYSIMLTRERWRKPERHRNFTIGIYNTGFMGFKKDQYGLKCLQWFRKKLIQWCYDRWEKGLWSDQLYVNDWPKRFHRVGIIKNIGVNVGPYIIQGCKVNKVNDVIYVNNQKLIFYHSYGFRYYDGNEFDLCSYTMGLSDDVIRWIYLPYIHACKDIVQQINNVENNFYKENRPKNTYISNYFNLKGNDEDNKDTYQLCTVMTKDYLVQGLALYNSLKSSSSKFHLWICCVDNIAYELLNKMNLQNVTLVSFTNIEHKKLINVKKQRKIHEYCWTLKAPFIHYLIKNNYNLKSILYIDADLFFFKDIKTLYRDWGNRSIYLTKLWIGSKWGNRVGLYSAGLIGFKRDSSGRKCLSWWRKKCLDWCYDKYEKTRWGDQKYLDDFPKICPNVKISSNLGINPGPWNIGKICKIYLENDIILFNKYPLICYHFSGFRIFNNKEYELCNRKRLPQESQVIYNTYIHEVAKIMMELRKLDGNFVDTISVPSNKYKLFNYITLCD